MTKQSLPWGMQRILFFIINVNLSQDKLWCFHTIILFNSLDQEFSLQCASELPEGLLNSGLLGSTPLSF